MGRSMTRSARCPLCKRLVDVADGCFTVHGDCTGSGWIVEDGDYRRVPVVKPTRQTPSTVTDGDLIAAQVLALVRRLRSLQTTPRRHDHQPNRARYCRPRRAGTTTT